MPDPYLDLLANTRARVSQNTSDPNRALLELYSKSPLTTLFLYAESKANDPRFCQLTPVALGGHYLPILSLEAGGNSWSWQALRLSRAPFTSPQFDQAHSLAKRTRNW